MTGIERDDGLLPPTLADLYGLAVALVCEGSTRFELCPRPVVWGHLIPNLGPGIWGLLCRKHGAVCRRMHPDHLVLQEAGQ